MLNFGEGGGAFVACVICVFGECSCMLMARALVLVRGRSSDSLDGDAINVRG